MKKSILLVMIGTLLLTGCGEKTDKPKEETNKNTNAVFTDIRWERDAENDIETIRFSSDGSFSYSCSCGNPVNDADLCETYTYNEETKEITLDCIETTDEMVRTIIVVSSTDTTLELDFAGEIRKFEKATE